MSLKGVDEFYRKMADDACFVLSDSLRDEKVWWREWCGARPRDEAALLPFLPSFNFVVRPQTSGPSVTDRVDSSTIVENLPLEVSSSLSNASQGNERRRQMTAARQRMASTLIAKSNVVMRHFFEKRGENSPSELRFAVGDVKEVLANDTFLVAWRTPNFGSNDALAESLTRFIMPEKDSSFFLETRHRRNELITGLKLTPTGLLTNVANNNNREIFIRAVTEATAKVSAAQSARPALSPAPQQAPPQPSI